MVKKGFFVFGLAVSVFISIFSPVHAQNRPVQVSLVTPIQIFPEKYTITGIRLNLLYGRNVSVQGLDIGLVNHTTTGRFQGLQYGLVGLTDADFTGWQDCAVNVTRLRCEGLQFGLVNYAGNMSGLQLGFVNYAKKMKGLQIGLVNIIKQGGQFPVFPIVNWSF
jgi:hypothetical protein